MSNTKTEGTLRTDDGGPDIETLCQELSESCTHATDARAAMARAENVRYCKWADQAENGRKPDKVGGKPAKPWGGSSDTRQRLSDEFVTADVRMLKRATRSGRLIVRGTEGGDMPAAGKTQIYLDYLRNTRMRSEVLREGELAGQWRQTYGYALTAITWHQEWARDHEEVTVEGLQQLAAKQPAALTFLQLASSPSKGDWREAVQILQKMYPDLDKDEGWRQLKRLREDGTMSLPVRALRVNRPKWDALKLWHDVFLPINTPEVQRSRWIAWRWTGTPAEVREKQYSDDWSEEFIEAVVKTMGKSVLEDDLRSHTSTAFRDSAEEMEGLCEVFFFYYSASDEMGLPCKYRTVISPHAPRRSGDDPLYGPDGPTGFDHGLYPFVEHRRERPERELTTARGVPEILQTNQLEVKWQRDARVDQTDLALRPPAIRPEREVGLPLTIEPMGEIGERRAQALRFLSPPPVPAYSEPLEAEARRDADRYFARNRAENPVAAGLADQDLADSWCDELEECWRMTLQLAQQFEKPLHFSRIVGNKPVPFHVSREEIQGSYDLQVTFNTGTMDPDQLKAKAEIAQTILLPLDRAGTIDWAPLVSGLFAYHFPEFADQSLRSPEQATTAEIKDEANNWGLILSGTEPEMAENGQNFSMRLDWLKNKLNEPGARARLSQLPDSEQLAERRVQHLEFMVQQNVVNPQTGRTGVPPAKGLSA